MPDLHFNITGDCSGAVSAVADTKSAIAGLDGTRANFSIGSSGADRTIAQLQSVGAARDAVTGVSSVDVQARGIQGVTSDLRGLRGEVASTAGSMSALNGMDIGGGSSVRQMTNDLGGARQAFQGILGDSRSVGAAVSDAGASLGQFAGDAEPAMAMVGARTAQVSEAMQDVAGSTGGASHAMSGASVAGRDLAGSHDALSTSGLYSSESIAKVGASARSASTDLRGMTGDVKGASNALADSAGDFSAWESQVGGSLSSVGASGESVGGAFRRGLMEGMPAEVQTGPGLMNAFRQGIAGELGVPVVGTRDFGGSPPGGGDGGGGGGGGGDDEEGRRGGRGRGRGDGGGVGGLGQPLMMGAMVGAAESLMTGAVGLMAVNEAITSTPDLAYAANGAMQQFGKGVRQAASSAISEGVPALHALRGVMHNLGAEVGAIGAEHMGTAIAGVSDLASAATSALKTLDPAVESSMKGLVGLGEAVVNGIANPATVSAIKGVGDALADPKNEQGIQSLVSGLSTVSGIAGKVAVDVGGAVGNLTGMAGPDVAPALQGGLTAGLMTGKPLLGGLVGLATLQAQQEQAAGRDDLVTPGAVGGAAGAFGGHTLGKGMGLTGRKLGAATAGGYILGDAANIAAAQGDKAAGTGSLMSDMMSFGTAGATIGAFGGPWGAAGGFLLGTAAGFAKNTFGGNDGGASGADGSKGFAPGATPSDMAQAGRYGWQQETDSKGNTTLRPGTAGDRAFNTHQEAVRRSQGMASGGNAFPGMAHQGPGSGSVPSSGGIPGFGPKGPGQSVGTMPTSTLNQLNAAQKSTASSAQQLTSRNNALAPSLSQVGQNSQSVSQGVQQTSQSMGNLGMSSQQVTHQAAQAAAQTTLMGASFHTAGQQAAQLPSAVAPTMNSLSQIPQQAGSAMSSAQSQMVSGGNAMGASMPSAVSSGISSGQSAVCDASVQMSQGAADCAGSALGVESPSTVFEYIGSMTGAGLAAGITGSTGVAAGAAGTSMMNVAGVAANYAKDAGLNLGTLMGTNLASGLSTTITSSLMKATGLAQGVDSPLAKTLLGQLGLLGSAGSGAQSWNLTSSQPGIVSFGSGTPANTDAPAPPPLPTPEVHVYIGNSAVDSCVERVLTKNWAQLASAMGRQRR